MAGAITTKTIRHRRGGAVKLRVHIVCDASGDASVTTLPAVYGRLVGVGYKPGTLDTGADLTLKDVDTGATIFSLTDAGTSNRHFRPTAVITTNAGVAVTAADTAANVNRDLFVSGKLSLVVAQGGNLGAGDLYLEIDDSVHVAEHEGL